jgi:hypothetical protein
MLSDELMPISQVSDKNSSFLRLVNYELLFVTLRISASLAMNLAIN